MPLPDCSGLSWEEAQIDSFQVQGGSEKRQRGDGDTWIRNRSTFGVPGTPRTHRSASRGVPGRRARPSCPPLVPARRARPAPPSPSLTAAVLPSQQTVNAPGPGDAPALGKTSPSSARPFLSSENWCPDATTVGGIVAQGEKTTLHFQI